MFHLFIYFIYSFIYLYIYIYLFIIYLFKYLFKYLYLFIYYLYLNSYLYIYIYRDLLLIHLRRGGTKASSNSLVSRWSGGGEPQIPKPNGAALATRLGCLRPAKNTPEPQFSKLILRQSFASWNAVTFPNQKEYSLPYLLAQIACDPLLQPRYSSFPLLNSRSPL